MNDEAFVKVFDVLDSGFKSWTFPPFDLIFVATPLGWSLGCGSGLSLRDRGRSPPYFKLAARL